jgi:hypothetical protein
MVPPLPPHFRKQVAGPELARQMVTLRAMLDGAARDADYADYADYSATRGVTLGLGADLQRCLCWPIKRNGWKPIADPLLRRRAWTAIQNAASNEPDLLPGLTPVRNWRIRQGPPT